MQAFMLYMSGGGVQIFSIGIVVMLLISPFKNLAGMNEGASLFSPSRLGSLSVYSFVPRTCSIRAVRALDGEEPQSVHNTHTAEVGLRRVQRIDACGWSVEVPVHGAASDGDR
jgi:hypothetical protein